MIAFDTNIAIYALNNNPEFEAQAVKVIERAETEGCRLSVVIITELLCFRDANQPSTLAGLEAFLASLKNTSYLVYTPPMARLAARVLREHPSIRIADAMHLATAATAGASEFWTNDSRLVKVLLPGLTVKLLPEIA